VGNHVAHETGLAGDFTNAAHIKTPLFLQAPILAKNFGTVKAKVNLAMLLAS
jgi:hypothetical protein